MLSKKNYKRAKNHVVVLEKKLDNVTEEIKVMKQNKSSESNPYSHKCNSCSFSSISRKTLRSHIVENHAVKINCKIRDKNFKLKSDLEKHILQCHDSVKKFNCDKCGKTFALKWRLQKHQKIHTENKLQKCHYYNNMKICPFEEIGCMFEHSLSESCKFGKECNKKLCSFQHMDIHKEVVSEDKELFDCNECEFKGKTATELGHHIDEVHEKWELLRDKFCDRFCRGDHGIHICISNEDFQEYIGFDIWATFETDESDSVYQCLKCEFTNDDSDRMRKHIDDEHKMEKASKCNLCGHQDRTWLGLVNHFRANHYKKV